MTEKLILGMCLTALSGCVAELEPVMLMPKTVDAVDRPLTEKSFVVESVTLDKDEVEAYIRAENFKIALEETIKRSYIFGSDVNAPYIVRAHVSKASFPAAGISMSSTLGVRYTVINGVGAQIMNDDVQYEGAADMGDEFFGSARAILAFQRTQQGHFSLFLDKLKQAIKADGTNKIPPPR
ncbi:MAG TPA: hypothetical protein VJ746_18565 [Nitrospira sp.]|nr:hypothetical protein [Nitrospira sp.]